jgi:hypothetical protein
MTNHKTRTLILGLFFEARGPPYAFYLISLRPLDEPRNVGNVCRARHRLRPINPGANDAARRRRDDTWTPNTSPNALCEYLSASHEL